MAARSVVTCTVGVAGSGKSFRRCAHFIINEFLPEHDGVHWSNFPLGEVPSDHTFPPEYPGETFTERIEKSAAAMHSLDPEKVKGRVRMIPQEELKRWETGESGPWEFFEGKSLQDAHIAIDEIHNFLDPSASQKEKKKWRDWLGEIRHQGATVEFISQNDQKMPLELRREAATLLELQSTETLRDPIFKIPLGDWYELRAKLLRRYCSGVQESEYRGATGGKRNLINRRYFPLETFYFKFYDSFSKPQKGGNKGRAQRRQWERRGWLSLLAWFIGRNMPKLAPRVAVAGVLVWVLFFGGGRSVTDKVFERAQTWGRGASAGIGEATERGRKSVGAGEVQAASAVPSTVAEVVQVAEGEQSRDAEILAVLFDELRVKYNRQHEQLERVQGEYDALRAEVESLSALVAVTEGEITLRSGYRYRKGEAIDYGEYRGRKIVGIDPVRRTATLNDGQVLRILRVGGSSRGLLEAVAGTDQR